MKSFMVKLLVASSLSAVMLPAFADSYLCSYTARISDADKYNSRDMYLGYDYSNATVASILRQDRANYYVFNEATREDKGDCRFSSRLARAQMQHSLANGSIPYYAKRVIVDANPLLNVDVYSGHVDVSIIENDYTSRSRVR